ncbi:MAG: choice-of-anchor Q domain-containing protein [Rhodanobacteraceae bacterium]
MPASDSACSHLRLTPLAACLGVVLAFGSGTRVLADPLTAPARPAYWMPDAALTSLADPRRFNASVLTGASIGPRAPDRRPMPANSPSATTVTVSNCNDHGTGSLRSAVAGAVSGDTIDLGGLTCSTITLSTGAITIDQNDLTLIGPGAYLLAIAGGASSGYLDRVFDHSGTGALNIDYLTITDATYATYAGTGNDGKGGCIRSMGNVNLLFSVVSSCRIAQSGQSNALGGGLYVAGNLTLAGSILRDNVAFSSVPSYGNGGGAYVGGGVTTEAATITGNSATYVGGGLVVFHYYNGETSSFIDKTTISDNVAEGAGGVEFGTSSETSTVRSSTISGNRASFVVGGILSGAPLDVQNSTIAFNQAATTVDFNYVVDVGLAMAAAAANLQSSIVANNQVYLSPVPRDISAAGPGASVSGNSNLVTFADTPMPADTIYADPLLYPLSGNGGPTETHALQDTSPAIDAGNNSAGLGTDQRLLPRVVGANADIGAFERQGPGDSDVIFFNGFD